jgi:hypothetical protein
MRIALDIETNKAHDTIWLCCTYDIDTKEVRTWTEPESFLQFIKDASLIVAHNGIGFDYPKLNSIWKAKITIKTIADTLVMSRLANPSREGGHSLKNLAKLVGRTKKEFEDFDQGLSQTMIDYCIEDTIICGELYLYLSKELQEFSKKSIDLEHRTAMIVSQQERNGFLLDVPYAMSLLSEWKVTMSNIEEELQAIFPPIVTERWSEKTGKRLKNDVEVFNVGSRQQVAKRLQSLGWVPKDFTETGEVKVDESILESLAATLYFDYSPKRCSSCFVRVMHAATLLPGLLPLAYHIEPKCVASKPKVWYNNVAAGGGRLYNSNILWVKSNGRGRHLHTCAGIDGNFAINRAARCN